MNAHRLIILAIIGLFIYSCGNKTKPQVEEVVSSEPQSVKEIVDTLRLEDKEEEIVREFAPPSPPTLKSTEVDDRDLQSQDELVSNKIIISVADVSCVSEAAVDINDIREHKVIVAESAPQERAFMVAESRYTPPVQRNEEYKGFVENKFRYAKDEPLSTFSIDVDAASYSNMRRFINQGNLPPNNSIRIEELINYFSYNYSEPKGSDPVNIMTEVGDCPWNEQHRLVKIGLKAKDIPSNNLPTSNFVFLVDVSGSMNGPTRLDLVKSSLKLLVNNLRAEDRIAIVVYAGAAGLVFPSTPGSDTQKIHDALDKLKAGGSTAGGAGIKLAYEVARKNYIKNGNNRIILCTDGDFNVGVSRNEDLQQMIEEERKSGVFLSILGYGMGNYKDSKMQTLAQAGNGNHAYIDNLQEANKVLVNEFGSTMHTVAKDVKLQIEFNPAKVQAYRLVGYESRLLNKEDFNDDTKDAGEMGAGHTVTAFYEVVPIGVETNVIGSVDPLKYQNEEPNKILTSLGKSAELLTVKLRYKQPSGDKSKKIEVTLTDRNRNSVSDDFRFAASVTMFGQLLKGSQYKGDASYDKIIALGKTALDNDPQGYRREFIRLVETTKGLASK